MRLKYFYILLKVFNKKCIYIYNNYQVVLADCSFGLFLNLEDEVSKFLRNVGEPVPHYTSSYPRTYDS
jgi:hypothetical protein